MQPRTSTGIKTLADEESTSDMMAFDDSNHVQRMDIFQNKDQLTISLSNVPMVQVGKSVSILKEVRSCCIQGCKKKQDILKPGCKDEGRVGDNSVPDDASTLHSSSSGTLSILSQTFASQCDHKDHRKTDDTTPETQQHTEALCDVEYRMPLIKKNGSLKGDKCEIITKTLVQLQDNGKLEVHENLACGLLKFYSKQEDADMQATLMIARGVAFYYANDLKKSRKLFQNALHMGASLHNRDLLQGKAHFLLAACYRRDKKFNKALQCLQHADMLLSNVESGGDKAELYYNYGTLWLDFYSTRTPSANDQTRKALKRKVIMYYEMANANCCRDERPRIHVKFQTYVQLKIAALHLDCGTKMARGTSQVLDENIEDAKKRLDFVEYQLSNEIPHGTKVQLLKIRSDQYYRQGKLRLAREVVQEALQIAQERSINTELIPLRSRIQEFESLETLQSLGSEPMTACMNDSGWSADGSSDA